MNTCVSMEQTKSKFSCEFCNKEFARESSIVSHMCEPKRRRLERSERGVQLGFQAYVKFYEMTTSKAKTFEDFAGSPYYKAFVKFGRYCVDIRAINPAQFMSWLLKNNKKIYNLVTLYDIDHVRTLNKIPDNKIMQNACIIVMEPT